MSRQYDILVYGATGYALNPSQMNHFRHIALEPHHGGGNQVQSINKLLFLFQFFNRYPIGLAPSLGGPFCFFFSGPQRLPPHHYFRNPTHSLTSKFRPFHFQIHRIDHLRVSRRAPQKREVGDRWTQQGQVGPVEGRACCTPIFPQPHPFT
jgi:hypothetical protein